MLALGRSSEDRGQRGESGRQGAGMEDAPCGTWELGTFLKEGL